VRADINVRVPDIAVTCTPVPPNQQVWPDPVVLVEILSPGNAADTWENVWSCCTIPSVREISVVHSTRVGAELLRRDPDGHWPERTAEIGARDMLMFESIGFSCPLTEVYSRTHLGSL
jgi:Uma2 family endonuclease